MIKNMKNNDTKLLMAVISATQEKLTEHDSKLNELENRPRRRRARHKEDPMPAIEAHILAKFNQEQEARRAAKEASELEAEILGQAFRNPDDPKHKELIQNIEEMVRYDKTPRFPFVGKQDLMCEVT